MTSHWNWYEWANRADAPSRNTSLKSWYAALPNLPPPPAAVFASAHALSELNLLHKPLSTAAHAAEEHVRKLESSAAFSSKTKPTYVENACPQMTHVGEDGLKHGRATDCALPLCWLRHDPVFVAPSWFSAPLGLTLPMGSRPEYWRNKLSHQWGDIEKHPGPQKNKTPG